MGFFDRKSTKKVTNNLQNYYTQNNSAVADDGSISVAGEDNSVRVYNRFTDHNAVQSSFNFGALLASLGFNTAEAALTEYSNVSRDAFYTVQDANRRSLDVLDRVNADSLDAIVSNSNDAFGLVDRINADSLDTIRAHSGEAFGLVDRINADSLDAIRASNSDAFGLVERNALDTGNFFNKALTTVTESLAEAATFSERASSDALQFAFDATRPQGEATNERLAIAVVIVVGFGFLMLRK